MTMEDRPGPPVQGGGYGPEYGGGAPAPGYGGGPGYGAPMGYGGGRGMGMRRGGPIETKPFFMTSEFLATLLGILGIIITALVAEDLDSHRASALVAGLIAAYTISRGIAKSGTSSRAHDPREDMHLGRGGGQSGS